MPDSQRTFGVKSAFKASVLHNGKEYISMEERVLLYRAKSFDEAIALAEDDCKKYEWEWHNDHGETVSRIYLGECDAFEIKDQVEGENGTELFSELKFFEAPTSEDDLLSYAFGYDVDEEKTYRNVLKPKSSK